MSNTLRALDPSVLSAALVRGPRFLEPGRSPRQAAPVGADGRQRRLLPSCECCGGPARFRVGSAAQAEALALAQGDRVCAGCVSDLSI